MAQYARRVLQAGVRIVGGCCGTTPDHIKEIRAEARSLQHQTVHESITLGVNVAVSVTEAAGVPTGPAAHPRAIEKISTAENSCLCAEILPMTFTVTVATRPPPC